MRVDDGMTPPADPSDKDALIAALLARDVSVARVAALEAKLGLPPSRGQKPSRASVPTR